jgi:hypothetical protein
LASGSLTIWNQFDAGSIIVRHIKSIADPSLPLIVHGPIKSTHNASQGILRASFGGNLPYLCLVRLFVWQDLHCLTNCWTDVRMLVQYISCLYDQDVANSGDTKL